MRRTTILLAAILTARLGVNYYNGARETFYNLKMDRVIERAHENGIQGDYWIREDGVKMIGPYVIVAADWNLHPYGSVVDTSLGAGLVLDTGTFTDRSTVDIATDWGKGGKT